MCIFYHGPKTQAYLDLSSFCVHCEIGGQQPLLPLKVAGSPCWLGLDKDGQGEKTCGLSACAVTSRALTHLCGDVSVASAISPVGLSKHGQIHTHQGNRPCV